MNSTQLQHRWSTFLKFYSDQNKGRKTRLGIFEESDDVTIDYWVEDGLPFEGVDLEMGDDGPVLEVMLQAYTHSIRGVREIAARFSADGTEDGLDIRPVEGQTTILRFEP